MIIAAAQNFLVLVWLLLTSMAPALLNSLMMGRYLSNLSC